MNNFQSRVSVCESRESALFFEDMIFGSFKKQCFSFGSEMFTFVINHDTFLLTREEILEFCKSLGMKPCYNSDFLVENTVEGHKLENNNTLLVDHVDNPSIVGFFTFHNKKKENELVSIVSCKFTSKDEKKIKDIHCFFARNIKKPEVKKGSIYMMSQSGGSLDTRFLGTNFVPLERDNYTPEVLDGYDKIVVEFNKAEPNGCIVVANSPAGLGKTYLLRSLLGEIRDSIFVYMPPSLISDLAGPSLISCLMDLAEQETDGKKKNIILILEDADQILAPRAMDNMGSISNLLNLTDGMLGKILNIRIIATTNTSETKFDKAIMRPGRLCAHLKLGLLSREHGARIYERITGKTIVMKKEHTLAEVYGMANNDGNEVTTQDANSNKTGF